MDLLDFEGDGLYFDETTAPEISALLEQAAGEYAEGEPEPLLLRAFFLAPDNLGVLVALYRFYYYQHRLQDALVVADHALRASGRRLGFPEDWRELDLKHLENSQAMSLARFYLLALKGRAYLLLRQDRLEEGERILDKLMALDSEDRLGCSVLKNVLNEKNRLKLVVSK